MQGKPESLSVGTLKKITTLVLCVLLSIGQSSTALAAVLTPESGRPFSSLVKAIENHAFSYTTVSHLVLGTALNLPTELARVRSLSGPALHSVPTDLASNSSYTVPQIDFVTPVQQIASVIISASNILAVVVPSKADVSSFGVEERAISVAGKNISLMGGLTPSKFIPNIFSEESGKIFTTLSLPRIAQASLLPYEAVSGKAALPTEHWSLANKALIQLPTIASASPSSKNVPFAKLAALHNDHAPMVLGVSTNGQAIKKSTLPFFDRISLSLYCTLAKATVDQSRCNYGAVLAGTIPTNEEQVLTSSTQPTTSSSTLELLAKALETKSATPVYITKYVTIAGAAGRDGRDGVDGQNGTNGISSINNIQAPAGLGSYIIPSYSNPSATVGISTIGYLKDATLDTPVINGGTAKNLSLFLPVLENSVFNGTSIFNGPAAFGSSAIFSSTVAINNLTATSSTFLDSTTTNAYITNLVAASSTLTDLIVTNAAVTNASTTNSYITNLFVDAATSTDSYITRLVAASSTLTDAMLTNSTTTNAYITNLVAASSTLADLVVTNAVVTNSTTTNAYIATLAAASSTIVDLIATNSSSTNSFATNFFATNATTTNLFVNSLTVGSSTSGDMLLTGTLTVQGTTTLATTTATSFVATNATTSTLFSSLLTALTGYFTNLNATNATTTNLFTQNLTVGDNVTQGNQVVNGSFNVSGTSTMQSNVFLNGNVVVGTSSNDLFTVNALVNSNITPAANKVYDLGSPSFYWKTLYADSINVNSISAASTTISGTSNNTFTINSDNGTTDSEDASLVFFRGLVTPNALLRWNATTKRFEMNQSFTIMNETPSIGTTTLTLQGGAGQGSTNLFELKTNVGTTTSVFSSAGWLGIGTTSPISPITSIATNLGDPNIKGYQKGITNIYFSTSTFDGGGLSAYRARGTAANPQSVQNTDILGGVLLGGYDGSSYLTTAYVLANNSNNGNVATGSIPTDLQFWTGSSDTGGTAPVNRLSIKYDGRISLGSVTNSPVATVDIRGLATSSINILNVASSSGTSFFAITPTGNVGIGTTTPAANFMVMGTNQASTSTTNGATSQGNISVFTTGLGGIDQGGSIIMGGNVNTTSGQALNGFAQISGRKETAADVNSRGYLAFSTNGTGTSSLVMAERARITSDGTFVINNNGANVPSIKAFIVKGSAGQTANLQEWQNSAGSYLTGVNANGAIGIGAAATSYLTVNVATTSTAVSFTNAGSGTVLAINANGAAGSPLVVTDVQYLPSIDITKTTGAVVSNGAATGFRFVGTYSHNGAAGPGRGIDVTVSNNTATTSTLYGAIISATAAQSGATAVGLSVTASTTAGTAYAALFTGGGVGIGTTTPSNILDVIGATNAGTSRGISLIADSNPTAQGLGGPITLTAGTAGGSSRTGGAVTITAGNGAANAGFGGAITLLGGTGGAQSAVGTSGTGGALSFTGGTGGASNVSGSGTNLGGTGAGITLTAGTGGAAANGTTNNGGSGGSLTFAGGIGGVGTTANGTGGAIIFQTAQTTSLAERMRIDASGNLGLGTTSPVGRFAITGTGLTTGIGFQVANASNSPSFTVLDNGNIGIGTTTPLSPVVVTASTSFTQGSLTSIVAPAVNVGVNGINGLNVDMSAAIAGVRNVTGITTAAFTGGANSTVNSGITVGTVTGTGNSSNYGVYVNVPTGGVGGGSTNAGLRLTGGSVLSGRYYSLYSDSVADSYFAGNIGMGTTTPQSKLELTGMNAANGLTFSSSTSGTFYSQIYSTGSNLVINNQNPSGGVIQFLHNGTTALNYVANMFGNSLYTGLQSAATNKDFALTSGGGLLLTTNGRNNTLPALYLASSTASALIGVGTSSPSATFFVQGSASSTLNPFAVASSSGTNLAFIDPVGRLSVNTAAPVGRLHVSETVNTNRPTAQFDRSISGIANGTAYQNLTLNSIADSNYSSATTSGMYGFINYWQGNISGTTTGAHIGMFNQMKITSGTGFFNTILAPSKNVFEYAGGSTAISALNVVHAETAIYGGSGNITNVSLLRGINGLATSTYSGTVTNYYGLNLDAITGATNNYSIYSAGGTMYHAGNIGIGTSTPTQKLVVAGNIAPSADFTYDLGTSTSRWNNLFVNAITATSSVIDNATSTNLFATNASFTNLAVSSVNPGFTTGSVVFASTSGALTQSNSQFFWDNTNNRLGIGTTTPGSALTVVGQGLFTSNITSQGNVLGNNLQCTTSGCGVTFIGGSHSITRQGVDLRLTASSGGGAGNALTFVSEIGEVFRVNGTTGNFALGTSTFANARMTIVGAAGTTTDTFRVASSSAQVLFNVTSAGNVGIGTTSPAAPLQIQTTSAITSFTSNGISNIRMGGNNGTSPFSPAIVFDNASTTWTLDNNSTNNNLRFVYNGATVPVTFTSGGSVGIGVSAPGASTKLQVAGMGLFTGGTLNPGDLTPAGVSIGYSTSTNTGFIAALQTGSAWKDLGLGVSGTQMYLKSDSTVGVGTTSPAATLFVQGIASSTLNPFAVASSSGTNLFTITPTGNVGIGTTTPAQALAVVGNTFINGYQTLTYASALPSAASTAQLNMSAGQCGSGFSCLNLNGNQAFMGINNVGGSAISIIHGNSNISFTFDSSLNNSRVPLTVSATTTSSGTSTGALTVAGGAGIAGALNVGGQGYFAGNVGIGTTTPSQALSVVGNSYFSDYQTWGDAGSIPATTNSRLNIGVTSCGSGFRCLTLNGTSGSMGIYNAGAGALTIFHGTSFASSSFQFALTGNTSQVALNVAATTASSGTSTGALTVAGGAGITGALNVGGQAYFAGNVGIGTTTPGARLDLDTGGVRVFGNVQTDYVTSNTFLGVNSGNGMTAGGPSVNNTFIGFGAGQSATSSGSSNTFIGAASGQSNTTGNYIVGIGVNAFNRAVSADNSIAIGLNAAFNTTTGIQNTIIGSSAFLNNTTGNNNIVIGLSGASVLLDGSSVASTTNNGVYIGNNTRVSSNSATNEIVIGNSAVGAGSNTVTLGNTSIATTILQGNVGIGTTTPGYKLSVVGDGYFGGNLTATGTLTVSGTATSSFAGALTVGGQSYFAGNVGIGTTTPVNALDVIGNIGFGTSNDFISRPGAGQLRISLGGVQVGLFQRSGANNQLLVPQVIGDTAVGGSLSLQSTTGAGTTDFIRFLVGNNGATEAMRIVNGGNVGIGTTTPGYKLSVVGDGYFGGNLTATGTLTVSGTATSSFAGALTVGGQSYFAGSVGIGTTSPVSQFAISGASAGITLDRSGGGLNEPFIQLQSAGSSIGQLRGITSGGLRFTNGSSATEWARFGSTGNFSIGTTTNNQMLTVAGNGLFGGNLYPTLDATYDLGSSTARWNNLYVATLNTSSIVASSTVSDYFTAASSTATSTFAGGFSAANGSFVVDYTSGLTSIANAELGNLSFDVDAGQVSWMDLPVSGATATGTVMSYTAQLGGNPMLTVYGEHDGQGYIQNPRFGFGTSTPTSYFHVVATGTAALFTVGTSSNQSLFNILANGNVGVGSSTPNAKLTVTGNGITTGIGFQITNASNTQNFTVLDNSSVSIGTTTTMSGATGLTVQNTVSASVANLADTANRSVLKLYGLPGATQSLAFGHSSNGTAYTIQNVSSNGLTSADIILNPYGGNVGVGTTSPVGRLSVTGAGLTTGIGFQVANASNTPSLTVLDNGNIGIGTTTPASKLDVYATTGDVFRVMGSAGPTLVMNNNSINPTLTLNDPAVAGNGKLQLISGPGSNTVFASSSGRQVFSSFGVEAIRMNGNGIALFTAGTDAPAGSALIVGTGNVGIGTTTPNVAYKLDVAGDINIATGQKYRINGSIIAQASTTLSNFFFGGAGTIASTATGTSNNGFGSGALQALTSGNNNSAFGAVALGGLTSGTFNIAMGRGAGFGTGGNPDDVSVLDTSSVFLGMYASRDGTVVASTTALTYANAIGFNSRVGQSYSMALGGVTSNAINVGIGTTTPNAYLTVYGSSTSGILSSIGNSSGNALTILGNKNVGIGTTTPTSILTIASSTATGVGTSMFAVGTTSQIFGITANGNATLSGAISVSGPIGFATSTFASAVRIGTGAASTSTQNLLTIGNTTGTNHTVDVVGSGIGSLRLADTGGRELVLGSNRNSYDSISTTNAFIGLQNSTGLYLRAVQGNAAGISLVPAATGTVSVQGGRFTITTTNDSSTYTSLFTATTSSSTQQLLAIGTSTNAGIFNILSSGNVGIGTTSPSAITTIQTGRTSVVQTLFNILDASGTAQFAAGMGSNNVPSFIIGANPTQNTANTGLVVDVGQPAMAQFSRSGTSTMVEINGASNIPQVRITSAGKTFNMNVTSNTFRITDGTTPGTNDRMAINTNGDIGFGTTTMGAFVDVFARAGVMPFRVSSSSLTSLFEIEQNGNVGIGTTTAVGRLSIVGAGTTTGIGFQVADVNNSPLFTTLDNGNVGIGTTTPGQKLTVVGNIQISGTSNGLYFPDGTFMGTAAGTSTGITSPTDVALAADNDTNGSGVLTFSTQGSERVRIENNGKVGIGTSTFSTNTQLLNVAGAGLFTGAVNVLTAGSTFAANGSTALNLTNSGVTIGTIGLDTGNNMVFNSGLAGRNIILGNSSGNVSVGTTTPAAKLYVQGSTGSNLPLFAVASTTGAGGATTSVFLISAAGNVGVGTTTTTGNTMFAVSSSTVSASSTLFGVYSANGKALIEASDNGNNGIVTIGATGANSQSISIIPRFTSVVFPVGNAGAMIQSSGATGLGLFGGANTGVSLGVGTTLAQFIDRNGQISIGTSTTNVATFFVQGTASSTQNMFAVASSSGAQVFTINTLGNIGVGTSTASSTFAIVGASSTSLYAQSISAPVGTSIPTNGYNWMNMTDASGTSYFTIGTGAVGANNVLALSTQSTNKTLQLVSNGGVSIIAPGSNSGALTLGTNGGGTISGNASFLAFSAGSAERMRINAAGDVGVGTSTPFAKFSIQGTLGSTTPLFAVASTTAAGGATSTAFIVLANGNVGIGTSTPGSMLDVWSTTSSSDVDLFRIASNVGSTNNIVFRVDSDGDIFTDGATTVGTPADIAESYTALEAVDAGTVVAFGTSTTAWSAMNGSATTTASSSDVYEIAGVRKATVGYEAIGIISTRPGLHMGANIYNGVPVAMTGRVPVKVTTENGEVKRGDYLTVSLTRPGYAMKLTGEGRSIGRAISDAAPGNDKVMVYIENGYEKVDMAGKNATTTGMLTTGNVDLNANGVAIINIKSLASANGTWSIDENGRIVAKVLCLEDVCIDKQQLTNILNSTGQTGTVNTNQTSESTGTTTTSATTTPEGQVAGTSTEANPVDNSQPPVISEDPVITGPTDPAPVTASDSAPVSQGDSVGEPAI